MLLLAGFLALVARVAPAEDKEPPKEQAEGWYCRFNVAALLRGDTQSRYNAYNVARNAGWLSVNEIRAGTYVLGDRHETVLAGTAPEELAAAVIATVVSRPSSDRFVVDAGAKSLTKDQADFVEGFGLVRGYPSAIVERLNDYHGVVSTNGGPAPELGESVAIVPNHICPVVDLFDRAVIVRGGRVIDQWRVDARGRSG